MTAEPETKKLVRSEHLPARDDAPAVAASLARFGFALVPVSIYLDHFTDGTSKKRVIAHAPWGAARTADATVVHKWWTDHPDAWPTVVTGESGIVVVDRDRHGALDGFAALKARGIKLPKTFHYKSRSGVGRHDWYKAPEGRTLGPAVNHLIDGQPVYGLDIRAGESVIFYSGPKLTAMPELAEAPEWVLKESASYEKKYSFELDDWLKSLRKGPAGIQVREALELVTEENMDRGAMLAATKRFAELGSRNFSGVREAVEEARRRYTKNYPHHAETWDKALLGSAQYWGKPVELTTIKIKGEKKGKKGAKAKKAKKTRHALVPAPAHEISIVEPHPYDIEDFFEKTTGLQSARLGDAIDRGDLALGMDGSIWVYQSGVWTRDDAEIGRRVVELLGDRYRREHKGVALDMVASRRDLPQIRDEPLSEFINLENGMYHWGSGTLVDHDPGYLSTVRLPILFDESAECPNFDAWLDEVVSPDVAAVIWELIAYSMMSGNPFQKAAMLYGPGGTGKGTIIRLIEHLVGISNTCHLTPADMAGTFEPATMFGKLLNTVGDLDGRFLPDTAPFKKVTGGDLIQAQHKNKPLFDFRPWLFPIFGTNNVSASADNTTGYLRRWLIIPFEHVVDRTRPFDEAVLWAESAGIFRKAMLRLPGIIAQNDFTATVETMDALIQFQLQSDVIRTWLSDDEHIVEADPSSITKRTDRNHLYMRYADWCKDTGHGKPTSNTKLYKRLRDMGYDVDFKTDNRRWVRGIEMDSVPNPLAQGRGTPTVTIIDDTHDD